MRLPDATLEQLLDSWPVARLATLGPDRMPHIVPIVFARVDPHLWSPIDGKPKSEHALARVTHLRDTSRVSVLIDHYDDDWRRLWWIRVDGSACVVMPGDPDSHPEAGPATARLRSKYPQYATTPLFRGVPTLIRVRITGIRSWCPGPPPPS
ncbi:MAG TPA: pyridoxamine 5'-phosphate oxidase family protein [Myxococcota bacterium]|nr:pyridoxamine 5'-phosphate oxidase family protein [Myxococcota bacterium]